MTRLSARWRGWGGGVEVYKGQSKPPHLFPLPFFLKLVISRTTARSLQLNRSISHARMTTFNLALLGGGIFATTSYLPALSQPSNKHINLHTLWSRSESTVETLHTKAKELGHSPQVLFGPEALQKIWDDKSIDAVSFVLPITAQPELILTALKAGKHVISEKPVGKDVQAARALIEEYEKVYKPQGLIWRVAESKSTSRICEFRGSG